MELLNIPGFQYPKEFTEIIDRGLVDLEPWAIMEGEHLQLRYDGLKDRYPTRKLIPFARRTDNDDIACWEGSDTKTVVVIHDFASHGWENVCTYESLWLWLKAVIDDMQNFVED